METIAIISIITSIGTLITIFGKTIKKSSCLGCLCESRTPPPSVVIEPPITPIQSRQPSPQPQTKYVHEINV